MEDIELEERVFKIKFDLFSDENEWSIGDMDFESSEEAEAVCNMKLGEVLNYGCATYTRIK
jgi:hypothetical protein